MKTPFLRTACALLAVWSAGCGPTDYTVREAAPTLTVALPTTVCAVGETLTGKLAVAQRGAPEENWSLMALVREGSVRMTVDDRELPATGEWMQLAGKNATLRLTPETAGEHRLSLQAMSASGEPSDECRLTLTAETGTELTASAVCEAEVVDPGIDAMLPIRLSLAKEGYAGRYKVVATLARGTGAIYHEGNIVTDVEIELEAETTLYFRPTELGEHIFEFTVTAEDDVAVARAYQNVAKEITVRCEVSDGIVLAGAGEGRILRNGAYCVNASIDGLTGSDIVVKIDVANWETLATQRIDMGC